MPVTLFKLAISADTQTTVSTEPDVKKYFYLLDLDDIDQGVLTIPAGSFTDDQGDPVTTITLATPDNGYYLLFINGVLQQEGLYTVDTDEVVIQPVNENEMEPDAPIVLVVNNFASQATSTTTVTT